MSKNRLCSRQTCTRPAIYTLTYAYSESTAVVGPLSQLREPHAYDLCQFHADRLTTPQGWELVRVGSLEDPAQEGAALVEEAPASRDDYPPLRALD